MAAALALMEQALANSAGTSLYQTRVIWLRARLEGKRVPTQSAWRSWWARLRGRGDGRTTAAGR